MIVKEGVEEKWTEEGVEVALEGDEELKEEDTANGCLQEGYHQVANGLDTTNRQATQTPMAIQGELLLHSLYIIQFFLLYLFCNIICAHVICL